MTESPRRVGALPDVAPDLAPFTPDETRGRPVIDDLQAALDKALSADVTFEPVVLEVPKRPGMSVRFSTDITDEKMNGWTKRSEDRKAPGGQDNLVYCSLIIATQCEALLMHGQEVHDDGGNPYTFGHKAIRERFGVQTAREAVRRVYGADPHVYLVANEILEKSGFGDRVVEVEAGEAES
jgi:hypothetical protein